MYLEDEEFDLVGEQSYKEEPDEDEVEETSEAEEEEAKVAEGEETEEAEPDEEEAEVEEKPVKDNRVSAISAERQRRKAAEKELKELKAKLEAEKVAKDDEEKISKERAEYKKKILEGDLVDEEVADKLLDVFGDDIIKNKIATQRRAEEEDFSKQLSELKKDDMFMDADNYVDKIKEFMGKGLTMEEAYFASLSKARVSQVKKDMENEIEQRLLNTDKADKIDVGHTEAKSEIKGRKYTKREQEIAKETGLNVEDVHKRSGMFELDKMLDL